MQLGPHFPVIVNSISIIILGITGAVNAERIYKLEKDKK